MKGIFLILRFYLVTSCSVVNKNDKYIKNFKEEFKSQAYCSCVLYGYDDKNITSKMIQIDKSFYNPIVYSIFSDDIIKMSLNESKIMKLDSINSIQKVSEGKAGKNVLTHCLNFYASKKLDSLTKVSYEKWKKIKNIDSLVNESSF